MWLRVDLSFGRHPKVLKLTRKLKQEGYDPAIAHGLAKGWAVGLWTWAMEMETGEDGMIPHVDSDDMRAIVGSDQSLDPLALLLAARLLKPSPDELGRYVIPSWWEFHEKVVTRVEATRKSGRERQQRYRDKRKAKPQIELGESNAGHVTDNEPRARDGYPETIIVPADVTQPGSSITLPDKDLAGGNGDVTHSNAPRGRNVTVRNGTKETDSRAFQAALGPVRKNTTAKLLMKQQLEIAAKFILSYMHESYGFDGAWKITEKKMGHARARLRELSGDMETRVSFLLHALDGAQRDDWIMGRDPKARTGGWVDVATILRDNDQVIRLAKKNKADYGDDHEFVTHFKEELEVAHG